MNERGLMSQPASSLTDLDLVVRPGLKTRDLSTTWQSSAYLTNKLNMQVAKKPLHEKGKKVLPEGKKLLPQGEKNASSPRGNINFPGVKATPSSSSETQGQSVGARESLNGRENMARRKVKDG